MTTTISVPSPLEDWIEQRVAAGDYASASAYVEALIRRDREDEEIRDQLVEALKRGEASGISPRRVPDILAAIRARSAE